MMWALCGFRSPCKFGWGLFMSNKTVGPCSFANWKVCNYRCRINIVEYKKCLLTTHQISVALMSHIFCKYCFQRDGVHTDLMIFLWQWHSLDSDSELLGLWLDSCGPRCLYTLMPNRSKLQKCKTHLLLKNDLRSTLSQDPPGDQT